MAETDGRLGAGMGAGADARERRALLERLLTQRAVEPGRCPASFAQRRLWFLHELEPEVPAYNVSRLLFLTGPLDVAALKRGLNEIVRRHEVLRTTFAAEDGQPVQAVAPVLALDLPSVDLGGLPGAGREGEVWRLAGEEARRPFDLAAGPLLRAILLRLGAEEHALSVTLHHIIADGWSLDVLFQELGAYYNAYSAGEPADLPELPIQYADFALWQHEWLNGEAGQAQLTYWKCRLEGAPAAPILPTDRPRPRGKSFRGALESRRLGPDVAAGLRALCRRDGVTPFMATLAAFLGLLSRYTGQMDLVVGCPTANRSRPETHGLIGFFVNTVALRADLSGDPTYRELLRRAREVTLQAYANQDLPFERLVEVLRPARSQDYDPLVQVMLDVRAPAQNMSLRGLDARLCEVHNGTAKFEMTMFVNEQDDGLAATVEYNADLFDAATVARMLGHFETMLAAAVADPRRRLSELPLLTACERQQLVEWNDTAVDYPRHQCIHELFAAQARLSPDAVAVEFAGRHLTYRELDRRANSLARRLRAMGVDPEVLVGICVARSLEMVVGILGILKAGGAYLPLDPGYPRGRLALMIEDARAPVLLTMSGLATDLPAGAAQVMFLDQEGQSEADDAGPGAGAAADNLAYVMYTSGSTGTPKGICVTHRNVVRLVKGADYADLTPEEVFLQIAPISFDAATFEIWGPLLNGGRLVVMPPHPLSVTDLVDAIGRHRVSSLFLTTALFHLVVDERLDGLRRVRHLLTGGEVLSPHHVRRAVAGLPEHGVRAVYGPTESTTFASFYPMRGPERLPGSVPIGRPIANTRIHLVDRHLNLVPVGVSGELCIGGDGLSRCYLNRPDLTAERFIPDPFGHGPAGRLYRTGDLARYLPDGNIEFLGRLDDQVKIRGFRVEPGEVEVVLSQHPALRAAVVTARESGPHERQLVAYIVPASDAAPTAGEMRSFLKERLPEYMVPAAFVELAQLPLTPNGKVDRAALPAPVPARHDGEAVAPRDPVEEALAAMWAKVLGLERVGIHDNFFELGGHSLLATRLVSRIREAFAVDLPLRTFFDQPTIAGLGAAITGLLFERAGGDFLERTLAELDRLSENEVQDILAAGGEAGDEKVTEG